MCVLSSGSSPLWGHHEEGQSEESEQIWWEHRHIHRILQTLWAHLLWRHILHYHDQLCKVKVRPKNKQPLNSRLQPLSCSLLKQFIMRELCFACVIAMATTAGWLSWFVSLKGNLCLKLWEWTQVHLQSASQRKLGNPCWGECVYTLPWIGGF